jgi:adenosylhomocysteine nucleosidase
MIGIIGAMESEVVHLISEMKNKCETTICGITYYTGSLAGQEVVLARAGIGKVNAALCAQTMILKFNPTLILNTGVAGAISPDLSVGDMVVATALVQHDMDTTPVGDPLGLLTIRGENIVEIPTCNTAREILATTAKESGVNVLCGIIATGDQFISTTSQKDRIREHFSAVACEMEGGAIAHACYGADVPCAVLRAISDTADGEAHVDYPTFVTAAAQKSAEVVLAFLSRL